MQNIWFYLLSSLAQVMAAIVALFGIFSVFKLDKLQKIIGEIRDNFIKVFVSIKNHENTPGSKKKENQKFCEKYKISKDISCYYNLSDIKIGEMFKEFLDNRSSFIADTQFGNLIIMKDSYENYSKVLGRKINILKKLRNSLILCSGSIIISLTFLSLPIDRLGVDYCYMYHLVILLLVYSIFTISYVVKNIYSILKE